MNLNLRGQMLDPIGREAAIAFREQQYPPSRSTHAQVPCVRDAHGPDDRDDLEVTAVLLIQVSKHVLEFVCVSCNDND